MSKFHIFLTVFVIKKICAKDVMKMNATLTCLGIFAHAIEDSVVSILFFSYFQKLLKSMLDFFETENIHYFIPLFWASTKKTSFLLIYKIKQVISNKTLVISHFF